MAISDPEIKDNLITDVWNLVGENVISGILHILRSDIIYYHTYRLAGNSVPDNTPSPGDSNFEGVLIESGTRKFHNINVPVGTIPISAAIGIDVYIYPYDPYDPHDAIGGKIRIDVGS